MSLRAVLCTERQVMHKRYVLATFRKNNHNKIIPDPFGPFATLDTSFRIRATSSSRDFIVGSVQTCMKGKQQ
jgi:hypothetical protein